MENKHHHLNDSDEDLALFAERLRRIQPAATSPQLEKRIGQSLALQPLKPRPWFTQPRAIGLAGLSAAACLVFAIYLWPNAPVVNPPGEEIASRLPGPIEEVEQPATAQPARTLNLLSYHRALRDSPASLDVIFDVQTIPTSHQATTPHRPLTAMDAEMFLHENERCDG